MPSHEQDIADRLERAADRMANAGFAEEERRYREAAATIRAGLPGEDAAELERRLLLQPRPRQLHRISALAAAGEYDPGGDGTGDPAGGDEGGDTGDQPGSGIDESAGDQLLSTSFSPGLSDPFSPAESGWMAESQDLDPFTGMAGAPTADPFTALPGSDPFSLAPAGGNNDNPFTTGQNVDPATGNQDTESFTGGGAPTDSPSQTPFSMAALGYSAQPASLLSSPDLLAQNDATTGNANTASDATSTGQGSLQVAGQAWAWTNFVDINGTTYNVFASPDGTMTALQASGGGPIVFSDSNGNVMGAQTPSGGYVFPELDVPALPPGAPLPADFVPEPGSANTTAPPASPAPDLAASPAPSATADPNSSTLPPDASPQAAPSSSPPPSAQPDAPSMSAGDPNQDAQSGTPGQGTAAGIPEEQREQENWDAAKSGMWDALVNMADTGMVSSTLHALGLPGLLDWAKSGPPAPTGKGWRDNELMENYQGGQMVTAVVALGTPIGAEGLLASAEVAFSELPALEGAGAGGGGFFAPSLAEATPTGASFEGLIDTAELGSDANVADRLSRARAFDIGEYQSLTGRGEYGRVGDGLDSDEALQNAFLRTEKGVGRVSAETKANPAMALPPDLHSQIQNLRIPQMQGMTPEQVLQFHIEQMYDVAPDYAVRMLERESLRFIGDNF